MIAKYRKYYGKNTKVSRFHDYLVKLLKFLSIVSIILLRNGEAVMSVIIREFVKAM